MASGGGGTAPEVPFLETEMPAADRPAGAIPELSCTLQLPDGGKDGNTRILEKATLFSTRFGRFRAQRWDLHSSEVWFPYLF